MDEFSAINDIFKRYATKRPDVIIGIGDDGAVLQVDKQQDIVASTDTLVENIHFLPSINPYDLGYRALAVNLSDLAAMAATPAWCLLSLTLPAIKEEWLQRFCDGFLQLANQQNLSLVGGNLSTGPLTITVQVIGLVPKNQALTRSDAKAYDSIFVTGKLGCAKAGLNILKNITNNDMSSKTTNDSDQQQLIHAFLRPKPMITTALKLRGIANSAIDISDGLLADLNQLLEQSGVGADIDLDRIPVTSALTIDEAVNAGEDYSLCFTVSQKNIKAMKIKSIQATAIGFISEKKGIRLKKNHQPYSIPIKGYQHF